MKFIEVAIETVDKNVEELLGDEAPRNETMCMVRIDYIESFWADDDELHINMQSGDTFVTKVIDYDKLKGAIYG